MIEKLETPKHINWDNTPEGLIQRHRLITYAYKKINELCDAVNTIQKEREAERFEIQEWIGILEAVRKSVNVHEKQIDELQMKVEPEKCKKPVDQYEKERGWIGCVCRFWYDNPDNSALDYLGKIQTGENGIEYYGKETYDWFPHCEPVKPDDDIIYKGE